MANLFENQQWVVTDWGIESQELNPGYTYEITAERLLETIDVREGTLYDWPIHMAEKSWTNIEAFIEAFERALVLHRDKYSGDVDEEMLERSLAWARQAAANRDQPL